MSLKQQLVDRIQNSEATLAVIGLGYVGLPLAVEFASEGFHVIGIDVDEKKIATLQAGKSYIPDVPTEKVATLIESGYLKATTDYSALANVDTVNICVPTPLQENHDPDMSYIISAIESIIAHSHPGMLIVLESTTYPGTTEEIIQPRIEAQGYTTGEDIFIAFSGERIDPGNATYGVHNTPKVVGGVTPNCSEIAVALYSITIETVVPVSSTTTAEMVKLVENTFRAVNIGLVNEIAIMCDRLGLNPWEVIDAAATKPFGFMPFYPGPGLGGHCIPIDPLYLSWKMKTLHYNARFIELADEINSSMPRYVISKITDALNDEAKALRGSKVVILGVAYKPNIDDVRESPALEIIDILYEKGADVTYHDPYVASIRIGKGETQIMTSTDMDADLLANADCVVVVTNHKSIDWQFVLEHSSLIVDTRHAIIPGDHGSTRVIGL